MRRGRLTALAPSRTVLAGSDKGSRTVLATASRGSRDGLAGQRQIRSHAGTYVWTASGRLFNLDMIADGYAFEYTYDLPYRYRADFKTAEGDARTQSRGLWSPDACPQ